MVRMVWIQCRERLVIRWFEPNDICSDPYLCCSCNGDLGFDRMVSQGQADHVRRSYRFYRRLGNNHSGIRFCGPHVGHDYRDACSNGMLYGTEYETSSWL